MSGLSRRRFLGLAGAGLAGAAAGGAGLASCGGSSGEGPARAGLVPFFGPHQAGIATLAQDRLHFAAFDAVAARREDLVELLRTWTAAAAALTAGRAVGGGGSAPDAPPDDTGEAVGLATGRLTLTFGVGPGLFHADRFGLTDRRPAALVDLPALPGDALEPARCGGDLAVQACADDPQVAVHAIRNLARLVRGVAVVRWSQLGFGRTATTSRAQDTPRNLLGFKDGTNNLRGEDTARLDEHVWVQPGDGPDWMTGGTYLVARRIRMLTEVWDRASLADQEATIGRAKRTGAPLGGRAEDDPVDLAARGPDGSPVVPADAHIRLAAPQTNGGHALLRRGYSFTDGSDGLGHLDAGLFFLAYQRDPRRQFIPIQRRLAREDALNEYIRHTGSAIFACPSGVGGEGDHWARGLFA